MTKGCGGWLGLEMAETGSWVGGGAVGKRKQTKMAQWQWISPVTSFRWRRLEWWGKKEEEGWGTLFI